MIALPDSLENIWEHYHTASPGIWLVISDVHIPCHSKSAVEAAVKYAKKRKAKHVLMNGDILDCHALSKHDKNPKMLRYHEELVKGIEFMECMRANFKGEIIYKLGNHEERIFKYLNNKAPELSGVSMFDYSDQLDLEEFGIELVQDKRIVMLGKLPVIHGHEFARTISAPVNSGRGLYLRAKRSAMCGHLHQTGDHTESDMMGNLVSCWGVGCLCELHPSWLPINKWNHGFAIVEVFPDKTYHVDNLRIENGKVL